MHVLGAFLLALYLSTFDPIIAKPIHIIPTPVSNADCPLCSNGQLRSGGPFSGPSLTNLISKKSDYNSK